MVASRKARPGDEVAGFSTTNKVLVPRVGQVLESGRRGQPVLGEPRVVEVDAYVPVVDRDDDALAEVAQFWLSTSPSRLGRMAANTSASSARDSNVLSTPNKTSPSGLPSREHGAVDDLAGVPTQDQLDVDARLGLELRDEVLGERERVVRDDGHGAPAGRRHRTRRQSSSRSRR